MSPFSLVPRDNNFFREFSNLAEGVKSGARELRQMIATDPPDMDRVEAIKEIEHACDEVTRGIIDRLNRTFVTPLDREDIHALAGSLDDVMDAVDAAAAVIRLYRITRVRNGTKRLVDIVCDSVDGIAQAVAALESRDRGLQIAAKGKQPQPRAAPGAQGAIRGALQPEREP